MDRPLISISILTFNRDAYLKGMLGSLASQARRHAGRVEVIVNDNASTDRTTAVAREMSEALGGIAYHRNDRNLGVIANYYLSFRRARGTFVCLAGDDDIYEDSFLDLAVAAIDGADPDLILFNRSVWNQDMSVRIQDRLMAIDTGLIYPGVMDLARAHGLGTNLAFNSAVLFRRLPAMAAPIAYSLQAQFPYPQIELYLQAFAEARCVVVPNVALRQRQFNSVMREGALSAEVTNSPVAASIGWIRAFLHFDRLGLVPFRMLFETQERDHWVNGTMADFIIPNLRRAMANGTINMGDVSVLVEAMHRLPDGDIKHRLFDCVAVAVDLTRLTERLLNLR
jgi:hypothetical protein